MKKLAIVLLIAICSSAANAQTSIAVNHNGDDKFYSTLDSAVVNSATGDVINIPGGAFSLNGTLVINKEIHLIGVGHHPDSTAATGRTLLNGSISIQNGASNGSISGILLNGNIEIGRTDVTDVVTNFTIERCNFGNLTFNKNGIQNNACSNLTIKENVINRAIDGGNSKNNGFFNNFFSKALMDFVQNNIFKNNLINYIYGNINGCVFENNIFYSFTNRYYTLNYQSYLDGTSDDYPAINCVFNNNMHVSYLSKALQNSEKSNYTSQTISSIFGEFVPNYSYSANYHILSTSPGHNGGTDGTDVGLYGGVFPWKDGSLPSNPHIQKCTISGKTDNSGKLQVNITVKAQDH